SDSMFGGVARRPEARAPEPQPEPVPEPEPPAKAEPEVEAEDDFDDGQRTQFYTKLDGVDLYNDQFHCLELADEEQTGTRYVVSPVGLKIGRSPPADIVLADPRVSRSHCKVELAGDELKITDLKSTTG